jgi:hypothetical protein
LNAITELVDRVLGEAADRDVLDHQRIAGEETDAVGPTAGTVQRWAADDDHVVRAGVDDDPADARRGDAGERFIAITAIINSASLVKGLVDEFDRDRLRDRHVQRQG